MPAYSAVVAPSGGDYSTLSAAIAALSAGALILVKPGTYTDAVDVSKAVMVQMAPGTSFTHASGFTQSAAKSGVLWGNGCSIPNGPYTQSGADSWSKARNGLKTQGLIVSGARAFHDGGGWGTLHHGGTTRAGVAVDAADVIVQNARAQTTTGSTGEAGVDVSGNGDRTTLRLLQVVDAEESGIDLAAGADDCLLEGVQVLDADDDGLRLNGARARCIAPHVAGCGGVGVQLGATGDDSVVEGGVVQAAGGDEIDLDAGAGNCVVVGNRVFGTINDNSGTSTVQYNDLGTASCAVTGTLADGCNESDVVAGGQTLILTLSGAVWRNDLDAAGWASALRALLSGDQDGATVAFDDIKTTLLASGTVVRTSDTVVTITLAAGGTYALDADPTNLITNGDFEGAFVGGLAAGWTNNGTTPSQNTTTPHGGASAQDAYAGGGSGQTISQTVTVVAGETYRVSAWVKGDTPSKSIDLIAGGSIVASTQATSWTQLIAYVLATSTSMTVFIQHGNTPNTISIDDVSVMRVGEFVRLAALDSSVLGSEDTITPAITATLVTEGV